MLLWWFAFGPAKVRGLPHPERSGAKYNTICSIYSEKTMKLNKHDIIENDKKIG